MGSNCPLPPSVASKLRVTTSVLPSGTELFRFHGLSFPGNSFNPHVGKNWALPSDGARFSPFPGSGIGYVPTIYAADSFAAAALESVFHEVPHVQSPEYPRLQLKSWRYSKLKTRHPVTTFHLIPPHLRPLSVPGRTHSLLESELIQTNGDQYPVTRQWAHYLHSNVTTLHGLAWRPRLGGQGLAYILFGDRYSDANLEVITGPVPIDGGAIFDLIHKVAIDANIHIVDGLKVI